MEHSHEALSMIEDYLKREFPDGDVQMRANDQRDQFVFRVTHNGSRREVIFSLEAVHGREVEFDGYLRNRRLAERLREATAPISVGSKDIY